jgi:hypothetical protein
MAAHAIGGVLEGDVHAAEAGSRIHLPGHLRDALTRRGRREAAGQEDAEKRDDGWAHERSGYQRTGQTGNKAEGRGAEGQRAEGRGQRAREAASAPLDFRQKFDGVLSKVKRSGTTGLFRHLAL